MERSHELQPPKGKDAANLVLGKALLFWDLAYPSAGWVSAGRFNLYFEKEKYDPAYYS